MGEAAAEDRLGLVSHCSVGIVSRKAEKLRRALKEIRGLLVYRDELRSVAAAQAKAPRLRFSRVVRVSRETEADETAREDASERSRCGRVVVEVALGVVEVEELHRESVSD